MDKPFRGGVERRESTRAAASAPALGIAHDFRNQLQLAASTARVVRREMLRRSDLELASVLEDGLRALDRANILAERLSVPGSADCKVEDVLLQRLVPEMRTLLSHALGSDVDLQSLVAEDLPPLCCDPLQLENVLLNLALNARQAMPRGGTLIIQAVECMGADHDDCLALSVADTGLGMSDDVAASAFEPYFSTRLLDGGTGLGLYNVRSFAESLGGNVELSTRENEGTRVILHLPSGRPRRHCSAPLPFDWIV
jgi:signal transduction histidine kinase